MHQMKGYVMVALPRVLYYISVKKNKGEASWKQFYFTKNQCQKLQKFPKKKLKRQKLAVLLVNTISGCSIVIKRLDKLKNHVHQSYKNVR